MPETRFRRRVKDRELSLEEASKELDRMKVPQDAPVRLWLKRKATK